MSEEGSIREFRIGRSDGKEYVEQALLVGTGGTFQVQNLSNKCRPSFKKIRLTSDLPFGNW